MAADEFDMRSRCSDSERQQLSKHIEAPNNNYRLSFALIYPGRYLLLEHSSATAYGQFGCLVRDEATHISTHILHSTQVSLLGGNV